MRSSKPDEREVGEKIGIVFPNQATWGTHVNISGAGVLKNAPNREAAIKFLEYLASDEAQRYFADGNNEWPVVKSVKVDNPVLKMLGEFKRGPAERRGARQEPAELAEGLRPRSLEVRMRGGDLGLGRRVSRTLFALPPHPLKIAPRDVDHRE